MRRLLFVLLPLLAMPVQAALARDFGSPQDAFAMLQRVIGAMQVDPARALAMINTGAEGFRDGDLYPYCGGPDGMFTAHPDLMGRSMRAIFDKRGNPLGEQLYAAAEPEGIGTVTYYWTRPGSTEVLQKVALVTRIGDQVCAVGYYRPARRGKEPLVN
jgi:hypothetical protein